MRRLLAALLILLAAPGAWAQAPEPLHITTGGFRPVAYMEDGHLTGVLCDLLTEAGRRAGIPVEIHLLPWARSMEETRSGRMDAIFPIFRTAQREGFYTFPDEVLLMESMGWFYKAGSRIPRLGDDPRRALGYKIGLVNRTSLGPKLDAFLHGDPAPITETVTETIGSVRLLAGGRVDLIAGFDQGIWAEAKQNNLQDEIRELSPVIEEVPAYLAFTRARDMGVQSRAIDQALRSMKEDGTYAKILARYFVTKPQ